MKVKIDARLSVILSFLRWHGHVMQEFISQYHASDKGIEAGERFITQLYLWHLVGMLFKNSLGASLLFEGCVDGYAIADGALNCTVAMTMEVEGVSLERAVSTVMDGFKVASRKGNRPQSKARSSRSTGAGRGAPNVPRSSIALEMLSISKKIKSKKEAVAYLKKWCAVHNENISIGRIRKTVQRWYKRDTVA
jgi:hypothetical protein